MKGIAVFLSFAFLLAFARAHRIHELKVTCNKKVDLALVLDASASVGGKNYKLFKKFARELISRFTLSPSKGKVSLNYFSAKHHIESMFDDEYTKLELMDMTDDLPFEGSFSSLAKTLEGIQFTIFAKKNGARIADPDPPCAKKVQSEDAENAIDDDDDDDELKPKPRDIGAKKVIVLFTDAFGSQGAEEIAYMADSLKGYGVEIFAVGVPGENYNRGMEVLVSKPEKKHQFQVSLDHKDNKRALDKLVKRICKLRRQPYHW